MMLFSWCGTTGTSIKDVGYNLRFEGNPGTGKTTVAALYAKLLADLGVIKGDKAVAREFERAEKAKKDAEAAKQNQQQQQQQQQAINQLMSAFPGRGSTGAATVSLPPPATPTPGGPPATPPKSFIETTGASLSDGGVSELKVTLSHCLFEQHSPNLLPITRNICRRLKRQAEVFCLLMRHICSNRTQLEWDKANRC